MPKNIIICSDGTGNTAIKDRGTNVFASLPIRKPFATTADLSIAK
jgi:hypothetical protein